MSYLQGGCDDGTKLSVWFFASHLENTSPATWSSGGIDYSHLNTGSLYVGNGTDFDTTYKLSSDNATALTIPPASQDPSWRCYFNFLGNETVTRLDNSIDLSSWTTNTTWTICIQDSTGSNCNNGNGGNKGNGGKDGKDRKDGKGGKGGKGGKDDKNGKDDKDGKGKKHPPHQPHDQKKKKSNHECKGESNKLGQMFKEFKRMRTREKVMEEL